MLQDALASLRETISNANSTRIAPEPPPVSFADREDREILVRPYREADFEGLVAMYDDFDSSQRAQGTPPVGTDAVREWLGDVLDGANVVALHEDRLVGHVTFVPDGTDRHELAIFVHQDYQRAGIGTRLLGVGMGQAAREDVEYVWLTVEPWKRGAQSLYRRAGFTVVNPMGTTHRMSRYL
ncbi:GNAT family N-acetyltransferase [Halorussus halobius]|uniref:GNAT family N-acetyltransferase n=1 Tax=Halorussus halobius TaxID=1710537 RepID=UPI0010931E92|nr:GNAT family N-acetyltransferase [Halorussus halobius]